MRRFLSSILALTAITGGVLSSSQADAATKAPQFAISTLRLPNGTVLTTQNGGVETAKWKDVEVYLRLPAVSPRHPYGQSVVGNHSQILSQQIISTPNGRAWFALNERTPPVASQSTKATYEYWVAMERTSPSSGYNVDYCIEAVVTGNRVKAKDEVMQFIADWNVPSSADAVAKQSAKIPFTLMTPNTHMFPFKEVRRCKTKLK